MKLVSLFMVAGFSALGLSFHRQPMAREFVAALEKNLEMNVGESVTLRGTGENGRCEVVISPREIRYRDGLDEWKFQYEGDHLDGAKVTSLVGGNLKFVFLSDANRRKSELTFEARRDSIKFKVETVYYGYFTIRESFACEVAR
jgi:hypothetical protein